MGDAGGSRFNQEKLSGRTGFSWFSGFFPLLRNRLVYLNFGLFALLKLDRGFSSK